MPTPAPEETRTPGRPQPGQPWFSGPFGRSAIQPFPGRYWCQLLNFPLPVFSSSNLAALQGLLCMAASSSGTSSLPPCPSPSLGWIFWTFLTDGGPGCQHAGSQCHFAVLRWCRHSQKRLPLRWRQRRIRLLYPQSSISNHRPPQSMVHSHQSSIIGLQSRVLSQRPGGGTCLRHGVGGQL